LRVFVVKVYGDGISYRIRYFLFVPYQRGEWNKPRLEYEDGVYCAVFLIEDNLERTCTFTA